MSRIGRKPISLPKGVDVKIESGAVTVKGTKGALSFGIMPNIAVALDEGLLSVTRANDEKSVRAAHGMTRAILTI